MEGYDLMITERSQCQEKKIRMSFRVGKERGRADDIKLSKKRQDRSLSERRQE